MVKIVGGAIVSEFEGSSNGANGDTNISSLTSNVSLYGYTVPLWTVSIPILGGFLLGGLPGGLIAGSIVGVGYCLSDSQGVASSSSQRTSRPVNKSKKGNIKSISDYPKPVKC